MSPPDLPLPSPPRCFISLHTVCVPFVLMHTQDSLGHTTGLLPGELASGLSPASSQVTDWALVSPVK